MSKANSLILLVKSLSKAEKKSIYLHSTLTKNTKDYMTLFRIIDKKNVTGSKVLAEEFNRHCPEAAFLPAVKYLYEYILHILVDIKQHQDKEYELYNKLLVSKVLLERNLNSDYISLVQQLKQEAEIQGNYTLLMTLQRMELEHLLLDGFKNFTEQDLYLKQNQVNETLKVIRQINEQSYLYETLRFRIEKLEYAGSSLKLQAFNDLVISEISVTSNLKNNIFRISKMHLLFQANYFISIGDYKSALNSFFELNKLFLENKEQWNNPPVYYMMVIEGILESLKRIKQYEEMEYYLANLRRLEHPSVYFNASIQYVDFIYSVIPYIEQGKYSECLQVIERFRESLIHKIEYLRPQQYLLLSHYIASIYLMNGMLTPARKQLAHIINRNAYHDIWVFRPVQLLNLIIYYEKGDFEYVQSGVRSIKRKNKLVHKHSGIESLLFRFFNLDIRVMNKFKKNRTGESFRKEINTLVPDIEERRILSVFDFPGWILSHFDS